MRKSKFVLLIYILIISILFSSCSFAKIEYIEDFNGDTPDINISEKDIVENIQEYGTVKYESRYEKTVESIKSLIDTTYAGEIVSLISSSDVLFEPEDKSEVINRLIYSRNGVVEETLNIKLIFEKNNGDLQGLIKAENKSGVSNHDIVAVTPAVFGSLLSDNSIKEIKPLTEEAFLLTNNTSSYVTVQNKVFGIQGFASVLPESFECIYFNTEVLNDQEDDVYELYNSVLSDEYSWDSIIEYSSQVGSSMITPLTKTVLADIFFKSEGFNYLSLGEKIPQIAFNGESVKHVRSDLEKITSLPLRTSDYSSVDDFKTGDILFMIHKLGALEKISSSGMNYGILPLPSTSDKSYVGTEYHVFGVSGVSDNVSLLQNVILALNLSSSEIVYDGYSDYIFKYCLRDENSFDMLKMILNDFYTDNAYIMGPYKKEIAAATYQFIAKSDSYDINKISDLIKKSQQSIEKAYKTTSNKKGDSK